MDSSSTSTSKRKPEDLSPDDKAGDSPSQEKKVRLNVPSSDHEDEEPALKSLPKPSLPADFFDDPSQAPQLDNQSEGPEEEDPEWKAFQASLQEPPSEDNSADLFAKASMIAEPVFYQPDQKASSQLPSQDLEDGDPSSLEQDHAEEEEEDPIEKKIREEKEEIMDRIQNEEREQLEADERVLRMKARINAFRARRRKPTNVDWTWTARELYSTQPRMSFILFFPGLGDLLEITFDRRVAAWGSEDANFRFRSNYAYWRPITFEVGWKKLDNAGMGLICTFFG